MTLILTVVDSNRIIQVSDRRLTKTNREIYDDNANKAVCVGMGYIHFTAAYTGLAFIGREKLDNRTDYWLLEQLGSITREGERSVENICRTLGQRAATALKWLRYKPLEVVLAGYEKKNVAFRAIVSNMHVNSSGLLEVRDTFSTDVRRFYPWSPKPEMYIAGAKITFEAQDPTAQALRVSRDMVLRHLKENRKMLTEERAAETLMFLIRAANTHKDYGYLIGRDCLSVVAFPNEMGRTALFGYDTFYPRQHNKKSIFTGFHHPVKASSIHYQPHLTDWHMDQMNVEADTDPANAQHRPPANSPVGTNLAVRSRIKIHNLPEGPSDES